MTSQWYYIDNELDVLTEVAEFNFEWYDLDSVRFTFNTGIDFACFLWQLKQEEEFYEKYPIDDTIDILEFDNPFYQLSDDDYEYVLVLNNDDYIMFCWQIQQEIDYSNEFPIDYDLDISEWTSVVGSYNLLHKDEWDYLDSLNSVEYTMFRWQVQQEVNYLKQFPIDYDLNLYETNTPLSVLLDESEDWYTINLNDADYLMFRWQVVQEIEYLAKSYNDLLNAVG